MQSHTVCFLGHLCRHGGVSVCHRYRGLFVEDSFVKLERFGTLTLIKGQINSCRIHDDDEAIVIFLDVCRFYGRDSFKLHCQFSKFRATISHRTSCREKKIRRRDRIRKNSRDVNRVYYHQEAWCSEYNTMHKKNYTLDLQSLV